MNANSLYGYPMCKFFSTGDSKWADPEEFDLDKYACNSSKGCVLEVDLEYPKELTELRNYYYLAADEKEIKTEMLSKYQLMISDIFNIPIGNFNNLVPHLFDKEIHMLDYENLQLYQRLGLKLKEIHHVLELNLSQWLKLYVEFNTQKRKDVGKNGDKDGKTLYKLMNSDVYDKTMETLRNRIDVKLVSNEKNYLNWTSKPRYMSQKFFENDLVAICKSKVAVTLSKQE